MAEDVDEHSHLLPSQERRPSTRHLGSESRSIISSRISKEEQLLSETAIGERLPYNDYTTIDWLHDLVDLIHRPGKLIEPMTGWIAAALIGVLTACVAFLVDIGVATVSDWKLGYCSSNLLASRERCCVDILPPGSPSTRGVEEVCKQWVPWSSNYWGSYSIYVGFALAFGIVSGSVTLTTRGSLPTAAPAEADQGQNGLTTTENSGQQFKGKTMYMAAGSGIPEIKTILSGFVIPHFLDFKVLVVKAIGSVFAVSTGMCLGKEGPFVHISTCVSYLVGIRFPKYRDNGRKMRELLSAGCSSGLSVAFGAPIGGVLFSYEEISTYFPRKVLWRAFVCSLCAAITLRELNPTGTGKLVLFETKYGTSYGAIHYFIFVLLGVAGGLFGGVFCRANFLWSKKFRTLGLIKNSSPIFEVCLVVLATALLQFPNPLTREPGDVIIKNLLVDCGGAASSSWVCEKEHSDDGHLAYIGWLVYGTLVKLLLTIITFGIKVPSGVIIPALDGGAFFGRLIGQFVPNVSPGIFAMVGAAAFLAGVSRMTISLAVIMFELTGELEYIVPDMIGIMVAKWVADALEREGVYDLAQTVLGHPFLDIEVAMSLVSKEPHIVEELIPPKQTMKEITVEVPAMGRVPRHVLSEKLSQLKRRGLMDAGLVLVQDGLLQGYLAEGELEFGLNEVGKQCDEHSLVRLLGAAEIQEFDLAAFVDKTPLTICSKAPMEYAVEMFAKLGLRYLCVVEEGSGRLIGVVIKKRMVVWLESLKHSH